MLAVSAIYSTTLLFGLDNNIVADLQGTLVSHFGHIENLTWIGAGHPLGSVALILPLGMVYGLFDVQWVYISCFLLFQIASVVCGPAKSMDVLIVVRVIAGMAAAGTYLG